MRKTVFSAIALMVFYFGFMGVVWGSGDRAIGVVADLRHDSGKLGTYRALIIGIDNYKDRRIPDLKTAVNDAKAMARVLKGKYGFQVKLMLGSKATKRGIYKALRRLAASNSRPSHY